VSISITHVNAQSNQQSSRFRSVPAYGRSTIRRFTDNVSDMHQFAASKYEDVLQTIPAVAEGLLPKEHDKILMDLLFTDAFLHALSMLRMHTTFTLEVMKLEVTRLGYELRRFNHLVCPHYDTRELPKEEQSRQRRALASQATERRNGPSQPKRHRTTEESGEYVKKFLSLLTFKLHILGHYPEKIESLGTTDNYNTKRVCYTNILPFLIFALLICIVGRV
jgi:hypothetical protein